MSNKSDPGAQPARSSARPQKAANATRSTLQNTNPASAPLDLPRAGDLALASPAAMLQLQRSVGNRAVRRLLADNRSRGNLAPRYGQPRLAHEPPQVVQPGQAVQRAIQRFTDEDVNKKAYEIWEKKGKPENQTPEAQQHDHLEAKRQLRAYEVWQEKGSPQNQDNQESGKDYLRAAGEVEEAHRLLEVVKAGGQNVEAELQKQAYFLWEQKGRPENQPKEKQEEDHAAARKKILDVMQAGLSNEEFAFVAASLMLSLPTTVVDGDEAKQKALDILQVELFNKGIARRLLDQNTSVVVIPRNKKMTDVVEFSSLAGTKTFDGRQWDEVRGSGGFKVPGKQQIYVAIAEENLTGKAATGPAAGTSWCYAPGYSTSSHEMAHAIDQFGLDPADKKIVDDEYQAKKNSEKTGTVVEWIDGFNYYTNLTDGQRNSLWTSLDATLIAKLTTAKLPVAHHAGARYALYQTIVNKQPMDPAWDGWLAAAHLLSSDKSAVLDTSQQRAMELDANLPTAPKQATICYAASHRLEYFAQTANAYFGTNTGNDPYTLNKWTAAGQADKARRRNGKTEVARLEPKLNQLFQRIFGQGEIKKANPHS